MMAAHWVADGPDGAVLAELRGDEWEVSDLWSATDQDVADAV